MSEPTGDERLDRGRELAELHLGEGVIERWRAVNPDMEELTSAFGFADLWGRPGLSRRDRSMKAITSAFTPSLRFASAMNSEIRRASFVLTAMPQISCSGRSARSACSNRSSSRLDSRRNASTISSSIVLK